MKNDARTALLRRNLDDVLKKWRKLPAPVSRQGWIHDIRVALAMTNAELALRMKVSASAVTKMERSEKVGGIRLSTLRHAARALNCSVVYALVPNHGTLEKIIETRLKKISFNTLIALIPLKEIIKRENMELVAACAKYMKPKHLWIDNPESAAYIDADIKGRPREALKTEKGAVEEDGLEEEMEDDDVGEEEMEDDDVGEEEMDDDESWKEEENDDKIEVEAEKQEEKKDSEPPAAQTPDVGFPRIRQL